MKLPPAPFPFTTMFQNGPRRQAYAPETLFKTGSFSPPRKRRAPWTAAGPFRRLLNEKGKEGKIQRQNHLHFAALRGLPSVGLELHQKFGVDKYHSRGK